jgi:glycerate 2-kinase
MRRMVSRTPSGLAVEARAFELPGRLLVIGVGKASVAMTAAAIDILGPAITEGIVVVPHGYPSAGLGDRRFSVLHSGHPVPDEHGVRAADAVAAAAAGLGEQDRCLFLISGGASALLPCPVPPLGLDDLVETTSLLLKSGASIQELNTVRKHLGRISGGRLAQSCSGGIITLAVSDVVGDELSVVGSGPTVPDPSTFLEARQVLQRRGLTDRVPAAVNALVEAGVDGRIPETPKSLPPRHAAFIVASSALAVGAAAAEARSCGYPPVVLTTALAGEAREAGRSLASAGVQSRRSGRPAPPPVCLIAAGETTVTVRGNGVGGRNQEIALSAALSLRGEPGILLASFATDGKEGNSEAAGAFASSSTIEAGSRAGMDAEDCLARNDSSAFLAAAGELIVTGPTGTNVNDLTLILVDR